MRLQAFVLLFLASSALALKGETSSVLQGGSIRSLQVPKGEKGAEGPMAPKGEGIMPGTPKGEGAGAMEDASNNPPPPKGDKKKDKKCKKVEKAGDKRRRAQKDKGPKDHEKKKTPKEGAGASPAMAPAVEPDAEGFQYCLQSDRTAEQCAAVRDGQLPVEDKTTKGVLAMELSYGVVPKKSIQQEKILF